MKKRNRNILIGIIIVAVIVIIALFSSGHNFSVSTSNCIDLSNTVCKSTQPNGYHQVTGDCSSIDPSFKCYLPDSDNPGTSLGLMCLDTVSLCRNAFQTNEGYYYCNIIDVVACLRTWDYAKQMWIGGCLNKECVNATVPVPVPECSENYMKCDSGSAWKCKSGVWNAVETCNGRQCIEDSYLHAYCNFTKYYCTQATTCSWSSVKSSNCYDTLAECQANLGYCCQDPQTKGYTWRMGGCNSNEFPFQGTDVNKQWCEDHNALKSCASCDDYALNSLIGFIWKDKQCSPTILQRFTGLFLFTPCLTSFIKYLLSPVVLIFSLLFGSDFLQRFPILKRNSWALWLVNLLIAGTIAYVIYIAFWIGIILFTIYIIFRLLVGGKIKAVAGAIKGLT